MKAAHAFSVLGATPVHAATSGRGGTPQWLTVGALAALLLIGFLLARLGWRRRAVRDIDLPDRPLAPEGLELIGEPVEGTYIGTSSADQWMDRVVAQGLAARGTAELQLAREGLLITRRGEEPVFVPAAAVVHVRRGQAVANKVYERGGLVVVRWQLGERALDTGFRPRYAADIEPTVHAMQDAYLKGTTP